MEPPVERPDTVTVRVYADLTFFLPEAAHDLAVPFGKPRSVKDLLESLGVPHPEVGLVVVDGDVVGFDHKVTGGERVAAFPPTTSIALDAPTRPSRPDARFVADVHLGTLARRLRVLGLDVVYDPGFDDRQLARIAAEQDRILLTRDRELLMRREVVHGYCPRSDDPEQQVVEVARRFLSLSDLAPFSRCPTCGATLEEVDKRDVADRIGPHTRQTQEEFRRCTACGQVYWPGTHTDHLRRVVRRVSHILDR